MFQRGIYVKINMANHTCCNKQKVKRGLWSPEEDEKLINYISTHGHGCWSTVPRLAGLQRCGKSCRLRWINYLRPDLKRGNFTPQEAALIIELHRILGNRWAQIARHLPGRTDNEVKNFWNSSIKKKLLTHRSIHSDLSATFSANHLLPSTSSDSHQNLFLMNKNNNNNPNPQLDQMSPNSQIDQFPNHQNLFLMNNYSPANLALMPPPSINISPVSDLPPFPVSSIIDENNFMFGFDDEKLPANYDQDSAFFDALMPEIGNVAKVIELGFPDSSSAAMEEQFLDFAFGLSGFSSGLDSGFGPVHPNHIKNITSLMASFAPPPPEVPSGGGGGSACLLIFTRTCFAYCMF
ncbi:hypothetical protein DH2020_041225 [Rehmannia glutinosa]|uniref:R2R3-MYB protein n=1 Tax=Rehmannia glutinosa TaxID=99300 RepID=A0ABR0URX2_REHGL